MNISSFMNKFNNLYSNGIVNQSNPIDVLLKENEKKITIMLRSAERFSKQYEVFDREFNAFLDKLPNSLAKKFVSHLFNQKLIFIGNNKNSDNSSNSRIVLTHRNELAGIILNALQLDINVANGHSDAIDECIYATYLGIIRSAINIWNKDIYKDNELNKAVISFLHMFFMKLLGRQIAAVQDQKELLFLATAYMYYRHFYQMPHNKSIVQIQKNFVGKEISEETFKKAENMISHLPSYSLMKDFGRMLSEEHIIGISADAFMLLLVRAISQKGFYAITGSLDNLIGSIILSGYPTDIISDNFKVSNELHSKIETIVSKYISKIKYSTELNTIKLSDN